MLKYLLPALTASPFFYWYWAKKLRFQGARVSWFRTWYNFYLCANPYNMIDTHYVLHVQIDMMAIINDPLLSKFDLYPLSFVYLRPKVLFSLSGQFCYLPTYLNQSRWITTHSHSHTRPRTHTVKLRKNRSNTITNNNHNNKICMSIRHSKMRQESLRSF